MQNSIELQGLQVIVDRVVYHCIEEDLTHGKLHTFIYFLTIKNLADRMVTLLGRKWVICNEDGTQSVVEGDKIVGETPTLKPGEHFSYNSYHVAHCNARAKGSFHGLDEYRGTIYVKIPPFPMVIPNTQ